MIEKSLKSIIKELSDRLLRTTSYDPERLDRHLKTYQIDAIVNEIDRFTIEFHNRLLVIESQLESKKKGKKDVQKN